MTGKKAAIDRQRRHLPADAGFDDSAPLEREWAGSGRGAGQDEIDSVLWAGSGGGDGHGHEQNGPHAKGNATCPCLEQTGLVAK